MTGQGLWTLRPGWRIERPLEAPWKPLQPVLTPSRGRGAREGRSKPERRGQEVDVKRKIRAASTVQGSICGLCRISKRVSAVSKKGIKTRKSMLLRNAGYFRRRTAWNIALRGYAMPNGTQFLWWRGSSERYHAWNVFRCLLNSWILVVTSNTARQLSKRGHLYFGAMFESWWRFISSLTSSFVQTCHGFHARCNNEVK